MKTEILTEKHRLGIGGVAIGTAFENNSHFFESLNSKTTAKTTTPND